MDVFSFILIVAGLTLFEIVGGLDNAVINAQVLATMSMRARRWFLRYGLLIAVFLIRGFLPFLIVWIINPALGPIGALTAASSADPRVRDAVEASSSILLVGGGTFLIFLFFHWLFLEPKHFGLWGERFMQSQGVWFYAVVSVLLAGIIWFALQIHPVIAFGAAVGSTAFFITHGFKENAEQAEKDLLSEKVRSDLSKLFYLEVIDAIFSIDSVLGAFAFTLSVPLILLGNGIGAVIVRKVTMESIEKIKQYKYLNNAAMYSVFFLGSVMLSDGFGFKIPQWITPLVTIILVTYFFQKSKTSLKVV